MAAHEALAFFGDHVALTDKKTFVAFLMPLRTIEWVVYAKEPFGGPQAALAYLSRYTHRGAISNRRLISARISTKVTGSASHKGTSKNSFAAGLVAANQIQGCEVV